MDDTENIESHRQHSKLLVIAAARNIVLQRKQQDGDDPRSNPNGKGNCLSQFTFLRFRIIIVNRPIGLFPEVDSWLVALPARPHWQPAAIAFPNDGPRVDR